MSGQIYSPGPPGGISAEIYRELINVGESSVRQDERLRVLFEFVLGTMAWSAHGTMTGRGPIAAPDIVAGVFQPVQGWQATRAVRGLTFDTSAGTVRFDHPGVYVVSVLMSMGHTDAQQGRRFRIRARSGEGIPVYVARNTLGTNVSVTLMLQVGEAEVGQPFGIEVGDSSAPITAVEWDDIALSVWQVGVWRADTPEQRA